METDQLSRKLAVILHADVVDSTVLVRQDETLSHKRIQDTFRRFTETISSHGGIAHEIRGDALVAEFARASDALGASLNFQSLNAKHNEQLSDDLQPVLRIGIAMGEVVIADSTVTGEGVVLAQRLEQLAEQGGICIQGAAYETVPKRLPFEYESLGEQQVKGFDEPVKVYSVRLKPGGEIPGPEFQVLPKAEASGLPERPSVAVLPFTNMSGDPEQEFFADGLTYDIIMGLSAVSILFVIARASSFVYKGSNADVKTIASELGVQYVLEGSVRRSTDRCRVNVQLVDAESDSPVWSQKYDRELVGLFELQDDIMQSVVASVTTQVILREGRQRLEQSRTDIRLWDLLSQARSLTYGLTEDSIKKSLKISERALSLFPDSGKANMSVANALYHLVILGYDQKRDESLRRARDLGRRALELDEDDEWSHLVFAWILLEFGEFDQAIEGIERGIEINPNFSMLYGGMADALSYARLSRMQN
jgi:adenylate cyclase